MAKLNSKYRDIIQTIQLNPKFILGGSCALRLLDLLDRETEDIDINVTQALTLEDVNTIGLEAVPTARTVPQIIIDGKLIGGWDDLRKSEFYANPT